MARITVEDCLDNVDNRFQLVLVATKRARQLALGSTPLVEAENDKPTVLALREIAAGFVTRDILEEPEIDEFSQLGMIGEGDIEGDAAETAEGLIGGAIATGEALADSTAEQTDDELENLIKAAMSDSEPEKEPESGSKSGSESGPEIAGEKEGDETPPSE